MHVIGIDGGGTKTTAALADKEGEVVATKKAGSSNPRNVGLEGAAQVVADLVNGLRDEKEIACVYAALSAIDEEFKEKREELKEMIKEKGVKEEVFIGSDQLAAFRAGTDREDGVGVICGTGAVAFGFKEGEKIKASGWGYLGDEGSAFYVGIEGYRSLQKAFDGRIKGESLREILSGERGIDTPEDLNERIYQDPMKEIPSLSVIVSKAAEKGDETAVSIMRSAGKELALSLRTVIEDLGFKKEFPVVLSGGMFNSDILLGSLKEEVSDIEEASIVVLKKDPVKGAVKLALENIHRRNDQK